MTTGNDNERIVPLMALRGLVIFPGIVSHFDAGRPRSLAAMEAAEMEGRELFLVTQKDASVLEPNREDLYDIGTLGTVKQILRLPGGVARILIEGVSRARLLSVDRGAVERAHIELLPETSAMEEVEQEALVRLVEGDLARYSEVGGRSMHGFIEAIIDATRPGAMADMAATYMSMKTEDAQAVLEAVEVGERLQVLHRILSREIEVLALESAIDEEVRQEMDKVQREYYLKEQMRAIRRELTGSDDGEDMEVSYRERIEEKDLPEEVREKALRELGRLSQLNASSPEYTVLVNYLDWILDLPWNEEAPEDVEIEEARKILDREHYGLKDVKERILEFIALRRLSGGGRGSILCLVGPPGVGKTSIARSVAEALGKEYVRMSLGGVTDEAEIRGHRRTYIGALPGRVISLMKKAGQKNPLFLFDEIDKVGSDYKGDPASGLLEVLDPEQNNTFTDHYLELPFDLSKVFFMTTANTLQTIPRPLLDRMEVITLGGYTPEEKFAIAKLHLFPKALEEAGMTKKQVKISDSVMRTIISSYTREAGVRSLEKQIQKIIRKVALRLLEKGEESVSVTLKNLPEFLGEKRYRFDAIDEKDQIGVVNGLAWTPVGGESLSIEVGVVPGKGKILLTGQLGDVMKESAMAALSYLAAHEKELNLPEGFREKMDIHIHVPEGAVPKDGPSAGISMCTAIYSALTERPVKRTVAMTGEITLRGRVLPIGGLKEKLLAAGRMGIKTVLIPYENQRDLKEFDEEITEGLDIHPVKSMDQVLPLAIVGGRG